MSVDLVNKAARVGIRQVVPMDVEPAELLESINIASSLERQRSIDLNLAPAPVPAPSAFSAARAHRKTTVSVNTAVALAKKGKRVMLIDCDLQFGDVNLLLDLERRIPSLSLFRSAAE